MATITIQHNRASGNKNRGGVAIFAILVYNSNIFNRRRFRTMVAEHGSKSPRTDNDSTLRERILRRAGVPAIAALTAVALVACSNTGAQEQPQPERPSISASQDPTEQPTGPDTQPTTPTGGEFESVPSGLEVDYDAFADWDSITSSHIPGGSSLEQDRYDHHTPGSKRSICYNFFESNGLEINTNGNGWELDSNGERFDKNPEFLNSMLARQDMVIALARDDTDPRNLQVALNVVECLTSPNSESRQHFISQIEGIRDGSIQPQDTTLQSVDNYVASDSGSVVARYTLVDSNGETSTFVQRWSAEESPSGLYRSGVFTVVE